MRGDYLFPQDLECSYGEIRLQVGEPGGDQKHRWTTLWAIYFVRSLLTTHKHLPLDRWLDNPTIVWRIRVDSEGVYTLEEPDVIEDLQKSRGQDA